MGESAAPYSLWTDWTGTDVVGEGASSRGKDRSTPSAFGYFYAPLVPLKRVPPTRHPSSTRSSSMSPDCSHAILLALQSSQRAYGSPSADHPVPPVGCDPPSANPDLKTSLNPNSPYAHPCRRSRPHTLTRRSPVRCTLTKVHESQVALMTTVPRPKVALITGQ